MLPSARNRQRDPLAMPSAQYHELKEAPLDALLLSLENEGASAVLKLETATGSAAISIADGRLRGAVFGELKGDEALKSVLRLENARYQVHHMGGSTPPPPKEPELGKTLAQPGGKYPTAPPPGSSGTSLRELVEEVRRGNSVPDAGVVPSQRRLLIESQPATPPSKPRLADHSAKPVKESTAPQTTPGLAPVEPVSVSPRAFQERDLSLTLGGYGRTLGAGRAASSTTAPSAATPGPSASEAKRPEKLDLGSTCFNGTSAQVALAPSNPATLPAPGGIAHDAPVPSTRFESDTLDELNRLNSAIRVSSRPAVPPTATRPTIPSTTMRSAPKDDAGLPRVGRYEVLARLKSGGMGSVYLCRASGNAGFRRLFAMKVLNIAQERNETALADFFREATVLSQMHHPNIVGIVDVGTPSEPYLVLDYVEGGSLRDLCLASPERRDPAMVLNIILDALAGLAAAHRAVDQEGRPLDVVHCDITPHNLLVGVDGATRVADFGIAHTHGATDGEIMLGKPGYVAPERLLREASDKRADIFSLGVVLYSALTGVEPFLGTTTDETLRATLERHVPPPSEVGFRPPPCLDWICLKALARDPRERFADADELRLQLQKVAAQEGLLSTPTQVSEWVQTALGASLAATRMAVRRSDAPPPEAPLPPSDLFRQSEVPTTLPPDSNGPRERTEAIDAPDARDLLAQESSSANSRKTGRGKSWLLYAAVFLFLLVLVFFPDVIRRAMGDDPAAAPSAQSEDLIPTAPSPVTPSRLQGEKDTVEVKAARGESGAPEEADHTEIHLPDIAPAVRE